MLGTTEIIIIALIVMLLFGASSIPKIARSLGQAKKEFEKGIKQEASAGLKKKDPKELEDQNHSTK